MMWEVEASPPLPLLLLLLLLLTAALSRGVVDTPGGPTLALMEVASREGGMRAPVDARLIPALSFTASGALSVMVVVVKVLSSPLPPSTIAPTSAALTPVAAATWANSSARLLRLGEGARVAPNTPATVALFTRGVLGTTQALCTTRTSSLPLTHTNPDPVMSGV
jgi:hypothetical protein